MCWRALQVVAFVKGTRTVPQCGFSHKVLSMLNEARADYEVVDVLDEVHNPGLREAIKTFSQWPTIPQVKSQWVLLQRGSVCTANLLSRMGLSDVYGYFLKGVKLLCEGVFCRCFAIMLAAKWAFCTCRYTSMGSLWAAQMCWRKCIQRVN